MQLLHHYTAIAVRDGKEIQLETKDLVQDDIVLSRQGTKSMQMLRLYQVN